MDARCVQSVHHSVHSMQGMVYGLRPADGPPGPGLSGGVR